MDYEKALETLRQNHISFSDDELRGNAPFKVIHQQSPEHILEYYISPFGEGYIVDGKFTHGSFKIGDQYTLHISGDLLSIDYSSYSLGRSWSWSTIGGGRFEASSAKIIQNVGPHKLTKLINKAPEKSKLWDLFHARAIELFNSAEYKGDYRE